MNYFTVSEQVCGCGCGLNRVDENPDFLKALNSARELYGSEMNATSMTRCEKHNTAIGGAPKSAHLDGRAADIACINMKDRMDMIRAFIACGFHRIEVSPVHIHVDMALNKSNMFAIKTERGIV